MGITIQTMKQYYTTTTYGGSAATYIIKKNGTLAYFDADDDDVIGARNVFKALGDALHIILSIAPIVAPEPLLAQRALEVGSGIAVRLNTADQKGSNIPLGKGGHILFCQVTAEILMGFAAHGFTPVHCLGFGIACAL